MAPPRGRGNGTAGLGSWTVHLTPASGRTLGNLWNGRATGTSGAITVRGVAYDGTVTPIAPVSFGFVVGGGSAAAPTGVTCSGP